MLPPEALIDSHRGTSAAGSGDLERRNERGLGHNHYQLAQWQHSVSLWEGVPVGFDDTGLSGAINLTAARSPARITVSNNALAYGLRAWVKSLAAAV